MFHVSDSANSQVGRDPHDCGTAVHGWAAFVKNQRCNPPQGWQRRTADAVPPATSPIPADGRPAHPVDAGSFYRLGLSARGEIEWVRDQDDGTQTVFDVPPETTARQRFSLRLRGPFISAKEL